MSAKATVTAIQILQRYIDTRDIKINQKQDISARTRPENRAWSLSTWHKTKLEALPIIVM